MSRDSDRRYNHYVTGYYMSSSQRDRANRMERDSYARGDRYTTERWNNFCDVVGGMHGVRRMTTR